MGGALTLLALAFACPLRDGAHAQAPAAQPPAHHLAPDPRPERPGFSLPDLAGAPLTLSERGGRVVVVHFFATWCEPCREELASLSRLVQGPMAERVTVLAVSVAEVPARVRRFLDAAPVSFPVVLDADRAVARAWGVDVLPTTFVLDPALQPRLFVEGDLDWSRPDVLSAIAAIDAPAATGRETSGRPIGRSQ